MNFDEIILYIFLFFASSFLGLTGACCPFELIFQLPMFSIVMIIAIYGILTKEEVIEK